MLDHHLQRAIVYKLALATSLRFSELKPAGIENKLFDYHLKKAVRAKYVTKNSDGGYALTPEGRRLGIHVLDNTQALVDRAYSVLFLVIRRKSDGAWLLYKRKNHPLRGKTGFMHATPNSEEETITTAARECLEKTGVKASFKPLGSGYFRIFNENSLESFTHFTMLVGEDAVGDIAQNDEHAEYFWVSTIDQFNNDLLPNMPLLLEAYDKKEHFFLEKKIEVET